MKIISGTLKGRKIDGYEVEGTRPTMDRVRESLFAMLQDKIKGSICLDLFSGTGSLGFESISNGASFCYFNDINNICIKNIKRLVNEFNISDKCYVFNERYDIVLDKIDKKLDIVFLDPPYKMEVNNEIIDLLEEKSLLKTGSLIVCEMDHNYLIDHNNYKIVKERKYGNKIIVIIEKL